MSVSGGVVSGGTVPDGNRIDLSITQRHDIESSVGPFFHICYPIETRAKDQLDQFRRVIRHEVGETAAAEDESVSRRVRFEMVQIPVIDIAHEDIKLVLRAQPPASREKRYPSGQRCLTMKTLDRCNASLGAERDPSTLLGSRLSGPRIVSQPLLKPGSIRLISS